MTSKRRALIGLADQFVMAGANAATGLVAYPLLPADEVGILLLALGCTYVVLGVNRAFVGEALLVAGARSGTAQWRIVVRSASVTSLVVGVLAAALLLVVWAIGPQSLRALVWLVPLVPVILLCDTARYAYLASGRQASALTTDLVWAGVQATAIVAIVLGGKVSAGSLLVCWGLGALASAGLFIAREKLNPAAGSIRSWLKEAGHVSWWFAGTAVIGQAQVQVVAFTVSGLLSAAALAELRLAQYGFLMPVLNLAMALMALLVPRASRLAAGGDRRALHQQTRRALLLCAVGASVPLLAIPLAGDVLQTILPTYVGVAALAAPVAIQAAIYLIQVPFGAALRGMQLGRLVFAHYAIFTAASLVGVAVGIEAGGLVGAAWGLTGGAAAGLAVMVIFYLRASAAMQVRMTSSAVRKDSLTAVGAAS